MIVLALPLIFLVGLSCARGPSPGHTRVTPETVIPSRVLPTPATPPARPTPDAASVTAETVIPSRVLPTPTALPATATPPATAAMPQSVVPTSPLPTPTAPPATATPIATPVVPTPTKPPATATPDSASLIAGLTIGPLRVHNLEPLDSEVDGSWLQGVLSLMPDSEVVREIIWMQNMLPIWKYYQLHGHSRPTARDGSEGYRNYILALYGPRIGVPYLPHVSSSNMPWISGMTQYSGSASTFSTMGFDGRNVDFAVAAGKRLFALEAAVGAYDPEITQASLAECADCMPHEEFRHRGYAYYSWGEDFKGDLFIRHAPPAFDALGRGGRISVQQGRVLRALSTDGIHSLIDAAAGAGDSLWDSEDMRLVAQAMADLGAYAVSYTETDMSLAALTPLYETQQMIRTYSGPLKPRQQEYSVSRLTDPPALLPFRAVASGSGLTSLDKPPHVFLIVVHDSGEAARTNAERLAARLDEGVTLEHGIPWTDLIQRIEMEIRGVLLLVRLESLPGESIPWVFQTPHAYPFVVHE